MFELKGLIGTQEEEIFLFLTVKNLNLTVEASDYSTSTSLTKIQSFFKLSTLKRQQYDVKAN